VNVTEESPKDQEMPTTLALPPEAQTVINQIVERFHPERIIVFGSYAQGTAHDESDVDLLVVMDSEQRNLPQAAEISREVDHLVALDIVVRRPDQVVTPGPRDDLLRMILDKGVEVYEAEN
jgi:uncharacterized protein